MRAINIEKSTLNFDVTLVNVAIDNNFEFMRMK